MIDSRIQPIGCLFATALVALAQPLAPPAPPAPMTRPAPMVRPRPVAAPAASPRPAVAPAAPMPPVGSEAFDQDLLNEKMLDLQEKMADKEFKFALKGQMGWKIDEQMAAARAQVDMLRVAPMAKMDFNFRGLNSAFAFAQSGAGSGFGTGQNMAAKMRNNASDDRLYQSGQSALDNRHWDQALEAFGTVAAHGSSRADGALYWKAYTLHKLGRRDEALAALAELRKAHAGSRWLDDAKELELEVNQSSGKPASPDQVAEEDLKVLALQGLMQSDPERAFPITENLLKSSHSPKLKRMVVYVLV